MTRAGAGRFDNALTSSEHIGATDERTLKTGDRFSWPHSPARVNVNRVRLIAHESESKRADLCPIPDSARAGRCPSGLNVSEAIS